MLGTPSFAGCWPLPVLAPPGYRWHEAVQAGRTPSRSRSQIALLSAGTSAHSEVVRQGVSRPVFVFQCTCTAQCDVKDETPSCRCSYGRRKMRCSSHATTLVQQAGLAGGDPTVVSESRKHPDMRLAHESARPHALLSWSCAWRPRNDKTNV